MVRFLKKVVRYFEKPAPEDTQAHKTANVDAKRDRQAEGEFRLGKITEPIRQMGLIGQSHQIPTVEGVLESQNKTERPRINRFPPRLPQLRLPCTAVATQVSAVG